MLRDIYPGVNLIFYDHAGQIEYDWQVQAGHDPSRIALHISGAQSTHLHRGDLLIRTAAGDITQKAPQAYDIVLGRRHNVATHYLLSQGDRMHIVVGTHNPRTPLVIDPVLSFAAILGDGAGQGIAVDSNDAVYVTGDTSSPDFPIANAYQSTDPSVGYEHAFITKLNASGSTIEYSTYLGGSGGDASSGIALDPSGHIFVTGLTTSADFPTQNPEQSYLAGASNAFVTELSSDGSSLIYSTYLGGSGDDEANGIALNSNGDAYVAGTTTSPDFPTLHGYQAANAGGTSDAFLAELDSTGSSLVYATYLGGSDADQANGIAVDRSGNAYIAGSTQSTNLPTVNAFQSSNHGSKNAFIAKYSGPIKPDTTKGVRT